MLAELGCPPPIIQVAAGGASKSSAAISSSAEFWEVAGSDLADVPQEIVVTADDLVDAALVGLAKGEAFTAPGLADIAGVDAFLGVRQGFFGSLLAGKPAARYAA
ncbi:MULTISPECIES: hypothetical protein [unclassified Mesorhizobium]|uniref:hypothetical protein n=1 Tax=unclassified Mesorhizobium TaxID=325217 RepID=UPI00333854C1